MKKRTKVFIIAVLINILLYLIGSFIVLDFYITEWTFWCEAGRTIYSIAVLPLTFGLAYIVHQNIFE